ncbi:MAG: MarR family transcriptional regulator [bacterium]|nr:MarR family transcriptional regulator [bacterium]
MDEPKISPSPFEPCDGEAHSCDPADVVPTDNLSFLLFQLGRAHRNQAEAALSAMGLHAGQEFVILLLLRRDGQTQSQIAAAMCVEPPTVTKMLSRMQSSGWVERRGDPADGRISRVYLTDRARAAGEGIRQVWEGLERRTFAGISEVEQAFLRRLLAQMHANLDSPGD